MKVLQVIREIKYKHIVEHDNDRYRRIEYDDNTFIWVPASFDGECDANMLEQKFQELKLPGYPKLVRKLNEQ